LIGVKPAGPGCCQPDAVKQVFELLHLYVSPGHNYFGHHGRPAGVHPVHERREARCVAGRGLEGDRFFEHEANHKGQITFFADEVYQSLCEEFGVWDKPPSVFRRNILTRGVDLNELIGQEFEVQGVRFLGTEECRPCHWMNQAFCPGAEAAMRGRGGLRARILTTGTLRLAQCPASRPASKVLT
jgi:MOSC domain-containing protein YiiM